MGERGGYGDCLGSEEPQRMIGRLERVSLREVWAHEAHDFTQWLERCCQNKCTW